MLFPCADNFLGSSLAGWGYKQCDSVAMGSALAVILANLWLSQYEGVLSGTDITFSSSRPNVDKCQTDETVCMRCQTNVTKRGYSIRCNVCLTWCHRKCTDLTVDDIKRYKRNNTPWYCGCHSNSAQVQVSIPKAKVFGRYVDDIIRTAKVTDIDDIMSQANNLHPCLKFTSEKEVDNKIPFLDMMVERKDGKLSTAWYSKPTDTSLMLSFLACARNC